MKRTPLKRKKGLKAAPRRASVPAWQLADIPRRLFREAAREQRKFCQCKTQRRGQAHHVLYEQHAVDVGANPHDVRNAMRVCAHCHYSHHHRVAGLVIPASAIPPAAREFLEETLGADRAALYLERYYA